MIIYSEWIEAAQCLPGESRLEFFMAIFRYGMYGELPNFEGVVRGLFALVKPAIDYNSKQYQNARKGGAPKRNANTPKKDTPPKSPEAVAEYCRAKNLDIDAEQFCDYWESVGWDMGGRTWQKAARDWANSNNEH